VKLFFISDIHGSLYYLKKALELYRAEQPDALVILGDELYHGPRNPLPRGYDPKEVAALLNSLSDKILAVRGNCDSEVDQMVLDFPIMADYTIYHTGSRKLFLTHGHIFGEGKLPALNAGDVFFYGHTHIPVAKKKGDIYIINPGSVSLPKEGTPHSAGILCGDRFKIVSLDGSVYKQIDLD